MSTSGIAYNTSSTVDIITEALEMLGVLGEGEDPVADQITSSKRTLNGLIKTLQADGLNLFAVQNLYIFTEQGKSKYDLYSGSSTEFSTNYSTTAAAATSLSGAGAVLVDDGSLFQTNDKIGLEQSDGTFHWATVSSVATNTVSFAPVLSESVLDGALVRQYRGQGKRPMKVLEAFYRGSDGIDTPVTVESRRRYNDMSDKTTQGLLNFVYFDPQPTTSSLYCWPVPDSNKDIIVAVCQRSLDIFSTDTDEPDFPNEWFLPLSVMLAKQLAPKYGIPIQDYQRIQMHAREMYEMVRGFDAENETSLFFKPETW